MENHNILVLPPKIIKDWAFRVSAMVTPSSYSVMVSCVNIHERDKLMIRFFDDEDYAAAFIDECVA